MIDPDAVARACHSEQSTTITIEAQPVSLSEVEEALVYIFRRVPHDLVLHGSWTTSPPFFGSQHVRVLPATVDLVCRAELLEGLVAREHFVYNLERQIFFKYHHQVVFTLEGGRIGDWTLEERYFERAVPFTIGGTIVRVAAPEYTIAMMYRKGFYSECRLAESDIDDIVNILASFHSRADLPPVALDTIAEQVVHAAGYRAEEMTGQLDAGVELLAHEGTRQKVLDDIAGLRRRIHSFVEHSG